MQSFADVKRRFQVGAILECVENTYRPELNGSRRRITKVQTNAIAWVDEPSNGPWRESWTYFPQASGVRIVDPDTFDLALHCAPGRPAAAGGHVRLRFA